MKIKFNFSLVIVLIMIILLVVFNYVYVSYIVTNWHNLFAPDCLIMALLGANAVIIFTIYIVLICKP